MDIQRQTKPPRASRTGPEGKVTWTTPERGVVKLNVSSICERDGRGVGLRIVALDCTGELLQTWAMSLDFTKNPVVVELEMGCIGCSSTKQMKKGENPRRYQSYHRIPSSKKNNNF